MSERRCPLRGHKFIGGDSAASGEGRTWLGHFLAVGRTDGESGGTTFVRVGRLVVEWVARPVKWGKWK